MRPFENSLSMAPDERRVAVARILAASFLRLHARRDLPKNSAHSRVPKNLPKSASPRLEVPDETVLSVQDG